MNTNIKITILTLIILISIPVLAYSNENIEDKKITSIKSNKGKVEIGENLLIEIETNFIGKEKLQVTIANIQTGITIEKSSILAYGKHYIDINTEELEPGIYEYFTTEYGNEIIEVSRGINLFLFELNSLSVKSIYFDNLEVEIKGNNITEFKLYIDTRNEQNNEKEKKYDLDMDILEVVLKEITEDKKITINLFYNEKNNLFEIKEPLHNDNSYVGTFVIDKVYLKSYMKNEGGIQKNKIGRSLTVDKDFTIHLESNKTIAMNEPFKLNSRIHHFKEIKKQDNGIFLIDSKDSIDSNFVVTMPVSHIKELKDENEKGYIYINEINNYLKIPLSTFDTSEVNEYIKRNISNTVEFYITFNRIDGNSYKLENNGEILKNRASDIFRISIEMGIKESTERVNIKQLEEYIEFNIKLLTKKNDGFLIEDNLVFVPHKMNKEKTHMIIKTKRTGDFVLLNNEITYTNITKDDWFYDDVITAMSKKIIRQTTDKFYPYGKLTKGELVRILVDILDFPQTRLGNLKEYDDVDKTHWAYTYIMRGKYHGILGETENNLFYPNKLATREDLIYISSKILEQYNVPVTRNIVIYERIFEDFDELNADFVDELDLVYKSKIIQGKSNKLKPKEVANRSEIITIIMRVVRKVGLID